MDGRDLTCGSGLAPAVPTAPLSRSARRRKARKTAKAKIDKDAVLGADDLFDKMAVDRDVSTCAAQPDVLAAPKSDRAAGLREDVEFLSRIFETLVRGGMSAGATKTALEEASDEALCEIAILYNDSRNEMGKDQLDARAARILVILGLRSGR